MDNTKQWIRCSGLTGCNHKEGVCTASPEYQAQFAKPVPTMDNTNAVLADEGQKLIELWFFRECNQGARKHLYALFGYPVEEITNHATEQMVLRKIFAAWNTRQPTQTDALREALDDAAIDEIILNFAGGIVRVPSEHNPRGYVSYYRPREAMRAALQALEVNNG